MRRFFLVFCIILFAALILLGIHQKINNYGGSGGQTEEAGIINTCYNI